MTSILAPIFAAGLAIQQILELADKTLNIQDPVYKKRIFGLLSFVAGLIISFVAKLQLLKGLGLSDVNIYFDYILTGIIISGGTEGINSILKLLGYIKDDIKTKLPKKNP